MSMPLLMARARRNHLAASGGLWTPASLAVPPAMWLNDTSTIALDVNGKASSWMTDGWAGGAGAYLGEVGSTSVNPAVVASGQNGLRTLTFDGVDDVKGGLNPSFGAITNTLAKNAAAMATFVAGSPAKNSTATFHRLFVFSISGAGSARVGLYVLNNQFQVYQRRADTDTAVSAALTQPDSNWHLYSSEHNWIGQTVGARLDGGTLVSSNTSQGSGNSANSNSAEVCLMGSSSTGGQFTAGGIGEVIVLRYIPTTDERQKIEGYLAWRWGVQANLPSGHPYKSAAPTGGPPPVLLTTGPSSSVSDTTARISFRTVAACTVAVKYSTAADLSGGTTTGGVSTSVAGDFTGHIDLAGLSADTTYSYTIMVNGADKLAATYPTLKTFPASGAPAAFSFAFGSCTHHSAGTDAIFGAVPPSAKFLLHLGDTIYADADSPIATTLPDYRAQHRAALVGGDSTGAGWKSLRASKPVFTIWDDHEITNDFSGGAGSPLYAPASQAFKEYHGQANPDSLASDGLYYAFQVGDVGFFVPDLRSYRSANTATDDGSKTILGTTQKAALKAWLLANKTSLKIKFICASVPAHGYASNTAGDSWGGIDDGTQAPNAANGFRTERNEIWDYIDANGITGVVFVSGDQHWAGSFKTTYAGRARYEFGASPFNQAMLTPVSRAADAVNGPVFWKYGAGNNMGVVTVDTTASPPTVSFQLYNASGSLGASYLTSLTQTQIDAGL